MAKSEIYEDPQGKKWKIVSMPDKTGGETVLVIEVSNGVVQERGTRTGVASDS